MRRAFAEHIRQRAAADPRIIFLTGDLGFMALEGVREAMGGRFINAGVSEQNMMSVAAGLASEGLIPVCYSIAPFAVFRPAEQIRNDICQNKQNVKIVGNGGGYGYGIMGSSHHALEDIALMSALPGMKCYIPYCAEDVPGAVDAMLDNNGPAYLRLGTGSLATPEIQPFSAVRKILAGESVTVVTLGPITLNALKAMKEKRLEGNADLFTIGRLPCEDELETFLESVRKTGKVLTCEEHVARGGVGEYLSIQLIKHHISCRWYHHFAVGYPDGRYGSQSYHQQAGGLDAESIRETITKIIHDN